jgi:hypothetical protein
MAAHFDPRYGLRMLRTALKIATWLVLLAIVVTTVSPIGLRPQLGYGAGPERAGAFLLFGFLFSLAYRRYWLLSLCVVVAAAAGIEALQLITPDRHARLLDVLEKSAGGGVGALAGYLVIRLGAGRP